MHGSSAPRVVGPKQHGRQECAARNRRLGVRIAGNDPRAGGFKLGDSSADVIALTDADECAHARVFGAWIPDLGFRQAIGERLLDCVEILGRSHCAPDRGALLPRLDRHFRRNLLDKQVELRRAGRGLGAEE